MRYIVLFLFFSVYSFASLTMSKYYLSDENNQLTINEIIKKQKSEYKVLTNRNSSFEVTDATIWIKVEIDKKSTFTKEYVLEMQSFYRGHIELFDKNGKFIHKYGSSLPFSNMSYQYPKVAIPLSLDEGINILYLKISSSIKMNLHTKFWEEKAFQKKILDHTVFLAIYFSGMFLLIFYNFIFFLFSKERMFLIYVFFTSSILITMLFKTGMGFAYIWSDFPEVNQLTGREFYYLFLILGVVFCKEYLHTKIKTPKLNMMLVITIYLGIVFFGLHLILSYEDSFIFLIILNFLSFFMMFITAVYHALFIKNTQAYYILIGWSFLISGVLVALMRFLGILEVNFLTVNTPEIGTFLEITLFSMALASSYRKKQVDLENSKYQLAQINKNLEKIIEEKNKDLIDKNKNLEHEVNLNSFLLKELSHRVKNNLQVILSFLSLQSKYCKKEEVKALLDESRRRVNAISTLHELLIDTQEFNSVDIDKYLKKLIDYNKLIFNDLNIDLKTDIVSAKFPIEGATHLGLIVNELFNNSCKHAFKDIENPKIEISLKAIDKQYTLTVKDNGVGLSENSKENLGSKIIKALISQLNGVYTLKSDDGFEYTIIFRIDDKGINNEYLDSRR